MNRDATSTWRCSGIVPVRHFKEEESGVEEMCEIMQKLFDEITIEIA